ncbi:7732_t:CDS:2, partial [Funneliformis geosporum]
WLALPHLARDGISERAIADNELDDIKVYELHQVKKATLNLVKELLNDINSKTESSQLFPYAREGDINNLPAETDSNKTDLPEGWRRDEVKNFLENKLKKLDRAEFITKFKELYFAASSFSDDQIYNHFRTGLINPTTGEKVRQANSLQKGWTDFTEFFAREVVGEANKFVYYAEIEGQEFNPNVIFRNEAIKEVWIKKFRNKNHQATISIFSHTGFQDENLNALEINKSCLQKVYLLLKDISRASLEDIPSLREEINNNYSLHINESKIPFSRNKVNTLRILNAKQTQLEAEQENNLAIGR